MAKVFDRTHAKNLMKSGTWADKYGFHWSVLADLLKDHPVEVAIVAVGGLAGAVLSFWKAGLYFAS